MNTLQYIVDKYKLIISRNVPIEIPNMDRVDLAELFNELGFTKGAEIGVLRGAYAKVLCQKNPNMRLFCVDPYLAYEGFLPGPQNQKEQDDIFNECKKVVAPYNHEFVRKTSVDAAKDFEDGSLDFIYLDANHRFEHVVNDLVAWVPKVRVGGVVSGHDFHRMSASTDAKNNPVHIPPALYGYTASNRISPWFVIGQKHCPVGDKRDKYRSWMWVKI
jgi:hypothetical protein